MVLKQHQRGNMRKTIGIVVILVIISLTLSACGSVREAEPQGRYQDPDTGEVISDTSDFLERQKDKDPQEYSILYELSKSNPNLVEQYVYTKSNESGTKKTIFSTSDKGDISKDEFLNLLSAEYDTELNPIDTINAYYSALKEREFSSAFDLLSRNGITYKSYGRPAVFEKMHYGLDNNMKISRILIETVELIEHSDPVIIRANYRIQGFFLVEPKGMEPPKVEDDPKAIQDPMKNAERMGDNKEEWEYTNSGLINMTLELQDDGKWLIHEVP